MGKYSLHVAPEGAWGCGRGGWLSVVASIVSVRKLGAVDEAPSFPQATVDGVVDLTGAGTGAGQSKKRPRAEAEQPDAGNDTLSKGVGGTLADTWVLLIRDEAGGEVPVLLSPHSTTLTPLLDPRADLVKALPKWKDELFSFLLSRMDDVAAGDAATATLLDYVQAQQQQEEGGGAGLSSRCLYRVDVCNKTSL